MPGLAGRPFLKKTGLGNDFVFVDLRGAKGRLGVDEARPIADRKDGIGCDQVITIEERGGLFMGVWTAVSVMQRGRR